MAIIDKLENPPAKEDRGHTLIDGDIVAYRAVLSSTALTERDVIEKVNTAIRWINLNTAYDTGVDDYSVYLTGEGNFRYDVATSEPYKGNRSGDKPEFLEFCRDYIVDTFEAVVSQGEEADDIIGIQATQLGPNTVVASIDKDMLQIPCYHFNFKNNDWYQVKEFDGLKFFYSQILTGDRVDNIIGLKGIGPVKAEKILSGAETEEDLWNAVLEAYDGDTDRVVENARLLWLRRRQDEMWTPPHQRQED